MVFCFLDRRLYSGRQKVKKSSVFTSCQHPQRLIALWWHLASQFSNKPPANDNQDQKFHKRKKMKMIQSAQLWRTKWGSRWVCSGWSDYQAQTVSKVSLPADNAWKSRIEIQWDSHSKYITFHTVAVESWSDKPSGLTINQSINQIKFI